jgi:hypothetical protein
VALGQVLFRVRKFVGTFPPILHTHSFIHSFIRHQRYTILPVGNVTTCKHFSLSHEQRFRGTCSSALKHTTFLENKSRFLSSTFLENKSRFLSNYMDLRPGTQ